ncbi:hypothetical protein V8E54_007638 [Elaphomyces granulatus]
MVSQLAYDSREKPVTKALLHPPDDRSDALISVHVPLKSCRDLDWAPRSWRSSPSGYPSGYETKGLGHPATDRVGICNKRELGMSWTRTTTTILKRKQWFKRRLRERALVTLFLYVSDVRRSE